MVNLGVGGTVVCNDSVHVGTGGGGVFWFFCTLEFFLRRARLVATTVVGVVTDLRQQVAAQQQALRQLHAIFQAQQARKSALQAQLADFSDHRNQNAAERDTAESGHAGPRYRRSFIESRAFSKLASIDAKAASWRDGRSSLRTWQPAVFTSSLRDI